MGISDAVNAPASLPSRHPVVPVHEPEVRPPVHGAESAAPGPSEASALPRAIPAGVRSRWELREPDSVGPQKPDAIDEEP
jgi:hypothetical protein